MSDKKFILGYYECNGGKSDFIHHRQEMTEKEIVQWKNDLKTQTGHDIYPVTTDNPNPPDDITPRLKKD